MSIIEDVRGTVLLAEDDESVRAAVGATFEYCGFAVVYAADGEEALGAWQAAETPFDGLVSDVMMPRRDGLSLTKAVLAECPNLPVVLMSGYSDDPSLGGLIDLANVIFLQKPFVPRRLVDALSSLLPVD
ncbi:MAG: CheY-like chemotaxis protein [Flavobacteriales bacterium]|jgi:CheY-like chemotaxis protein